MTSIPDDGDHLSVTPTTPAAEPATAESPCPEPVAQPADAEPGVLTAALGPGGLVEKQLERGRSATHCEDEKTIALHKQLSWGLEDAREKSRLGYWRFYHGSEDLSLEERFRRLVAHAEWGADDVLHYALAYHAKMESKCDELWGIALEKYMAQADAYDRLLGDLIPPDVRERGRSLLAHRAYDQGANATAAGDWLVYGQRLRDRQKQPLLGLSTGLAGLDKALVGLRGLTLIGGGTGIGKTALAEAMAVAALRAHSDVAVLFYSLDMLKDFLYDRLLCHEAGVTYQDLMRQERGEDVQQVLSAADERLRSDVLRRLRVVDRHEVHQEGGLTAALVCQHINRLLRATGARRALVVVDYLGLITVTAKGMTSLEEDHRRIELLKGALAMTRTAASPLGHSFLVISEVRKGEQGRDSLTLDDLLGSCRISYAPEAVLLLEADGKAAGGKQPLVLNVAKGRDGTTRGRLKLLFDYRRYRFHERSGPVPGGDATEGDPSVAGGPEQEASPRVDPLAGGPKGRRD
jgi:hypothetical protein